MGPETVNRNKDSNFYGPYAGRDLYITMYQDSEREFVVTHNANIKPVSYFTGRETELHELRQRIEDKRKSVLVSGMGGIGKTHICRKLFEEYLKKGENEPFHHIGYVEYSGDMGSSLQNCLKYKEQEQQETNQEAAWRELEYLASDGKLLIFIDNVDKTMADDPSLQRLNSIPGAVVLTSRRASFSDAFEPYRIGFLSIEQCREIYERIRFENSGGKVKPGEVPDLEYIIDKLSGRHTITVEFLAHLARVKLWSVGRLRGELEQKGFRLQFRKNGEPINMQQTYEKLYDLSKLTVAEQNILEAFSIFPYIPLSAEICNQWLLSDAGVSEDDDILTGLYQKGWLQFELEQESYSMHPVFAQFIYDKRTPNAENHIWLLISLQDTLNNIIEYSALECQFLALISEAIIEKIIVKNNKGLDEFIFNFIFLIQHLGKYEKEERWYKYILKIFEGESGINYHYISIKAYWGLAQVYELKKDNLNAKKNYKKAIIMYEKEFGKNLSDNALLYIGLAGVYTREKKYEKATELYRKSIRISEKELGENHPETAMSYKYFGDMYFKQGLHSKAVDMYNKSLRIYEKDFGNNYSRIVSIYNNLANICIFNGDYEKAEKIYKENLKLCESKFNVSFMQVVDSYTGLARIYFKRVNCEKAINYLLKAYKILFSKLGLEHPNTQDFYVGLETLYNRWNPSGDFEQWLEEKMKE